MFTDDIHPEELLVATRALTPDERADLRAHTTRCPACALQLALRGDVALALTPNEGDYELAGRALARTLAAPPRAAAPILRRRAPLALRVAAVVAVMLGTGVAASAIVMTTHGRLWGVTPRHDEPVRAIPERAHPARAAAKLPSADLATPAAAPVASPPAAAPVASPPAAAPSPPRLASAPSVRARVAMRARDAEAGTRLPLAPPAEPTQALEAAPAPATSTPEAAETPRAPEIFAAAARARRDGDATRAERLYAQLAADYPGTREELIARVLRGQALLDDLGRPDAALASFDAYLRDQPNGALAEQARAGRAQALWLLGRDAEEAAAWRDLLTAHPRSLHAALARSRLAALSRAGE
jgi:tetratricopeptide (TPR) repeat protein